MQCLTPDNALVCELALQTGWRIDDCLRLQSAALEQSASKTQHYITIIEEKTGKKSKKRLSKSLFDRLNANKGVYYVFQGRDDITKHRTRQAVWNDLKRARRALRLSANLSPHSLRKSYAVDMLKTSGDLDKVQRALNHSKQCDTLIYALADTYTRVEWRAKARHARLRK